MTVIPSNEFSQRCCASPKLRWSCSAATILCRFSFLHIWYWSIDILVADSGRCLQANLINRVVDLKMRASPVYRIQFDMACTVGSFFLKEKWNWGTSISEEGYFFRWCYSVCPRCDSCKVSNVNIICQNIQINYFSGVDIVLFVLCLQKGGHEVRTNTFYLYCYISKLKL